MKKASKISSGQRESERSSVLGLTGLAGAVDEEEEPDVGQTIDAAAAGFEASVLPGDARLFTLPPTAETLAFKSEGGARLKGYEIVRKFKDAGWCVGRVLTQASDACLPSRMRSASPTFASFTSAMASSSTNLYTLTRMRVARRRRSGRGWWSLAARTWLP